MKIAGKMREKFACPNCNESICAPVIDSSVEYYGFKRYRQCELCGIVFTTKETVDKISSRSRKTMD